MKKLFNALAWFDGADWGFFSFLLFLNLLALGFLVVTILGGAPLYAVLLALVTLGITASCLINGSLHAIRSRRGY